MATSSPIDTSHPLCSQLPLELLVQLGELLHGYFLLRPADDETLLVGLAGLRDDVEVDVVDDLVGDAAVVLDGENAVSGRSRADGSMWKASRRGEEECGCMMTTADGRSHLEDVVVNKPLRNGDLLRHDHHVLQILIWYIM